MKAASFGTRAKAQEAEKSNTSSPGPAEATASLEERNIEKKAAAMRHYCHTTLRKIRLLQNPIRIHIMKNRSINLTGR